jgi:hypothetical protein
MKYTSPFYYYGAGLPLVRGIDWTHAGSLLALAVLFTLLALRTFDSRDVTAGGATDLSPTTLARRLTTLRTG